MKIAVVGGTGLAGQSTVRALRERGHAAVVLSRSQGVDVITGQGLDAALTGVEAVVDASSTQAADVDSARRFFTQGTENLLAAERRAGVKHHVLLSIVGVDRSGGNPHFQAKRAQEVVLESSRVPVTIQRATQFYEFIEMVMSWARQGDAITLPPLALQPVAVNEVGAVLAELAAGAPQGRALDIAGPEKRELIEMARRILAVRGDAARLVTSWQNALTQGEIPADHFLPGPETRILPTTFDAWLSAQAAR